ncbi:ankyrin repeat domain-containing protein [Varunaivibrio sulfuroxidans]|uniref:Ankyrin repeat protein n=1 Tax=Varunaivibrio sulfuroxidans TaxID=1773489 RepID=A0A4R3J650_9PROT|nr:ankyrin repeat domain-containing protein [Varunaivibrio sulfuroxidans]TCS60306.1 ankyrin repeat protein [Varunaivibrio sulfuroxidans]WES31008.1 ankyrin repeat domain-containing protein [Varunaivibrio sulfuroxidans]
MAALTRRYVVVSPDMQTVGDYANMEGAEAAAVAFGENAHVVDMMGQTYMPAVQRVEDGALVYVGYGSFNRKRGLEANLIEAAKKGQAYAVRAYLACGANPNAADREGSTPLLFAIAADCEACVRVLLQAGAEAACADDDGVTPRELARIKKRHAIAALLGEEL